MTGSIDGKQVTVTWKSILVIFMTKKYENSIRFWRLNISETSKLKNLVTIIYTIDPIVVIW